ncbi:hypothetical protein Hanom_Chr13g01228771 [Helianthus anomalus]
MDIKSIDRLKPVRPILTHPAQFANSSFGNGRSMTSINVSNTYLPQERKRGSLVDSSPKSFNRWALQKGKKVRVVQKARGSLEIGSFVKRPSTGQGKLHLAARSLGSFKLNPNFNFNICKL